MLRNPAADPNSGEARLLQCRAGAAVQAAQLRALADRLDAAETFEAIVDVGVDAAMLGRKIAGGAHLWHAGLRPRTEVQR